MINNIDLSNNNFTQNVMHQWGSLPQHVLPDTIQK